MSPQQAFFTAVLVALRRTLTCSVYDGALPRHGVSVHYPFVYLGETYQMDTQNKSCLTGTVTMVIHAWHCNPQQRGTLSALLDQVLGIVRQLPKQTYAFETSGATQRIIADDGGEGTGGDSLMHGILTVQARFSPA